MGSVQWLRNGPLQVMQDFYSRAKQLSTAGICAAVKRHVSHTFVEQSGWADKGIFKPLSVWKSEGWDTETIVAKAKPEDIRVDPEYGWDTYRVRIHTEKAGEQRTNTDNIQILAKARTRALRRKRTDESPVHPASSPQSFSDESSDSDSSEHRGRNGADNRGGNGKKDKKEKNGKKDKKERKEGHKPKGKGKAKAKAAPENKALKSRAKKATKYRAMRSAPRAQWWATARSWRPTMPWWIR